MAKLRLPIGPDGFVAMSDPPAGCRSALRRHETSGTCWFRDDNQRLCSLHREFGEAALPSSCRQFPRVCVLEPDVVSVSLSHYCPTAAGLLFRQSDAFALVDAPSAFPGGWPFEGLDAREAYPPFLRPGVLLGADGLRALETWGLATLTEPDVSRDLARIESAVELFRHWSPVKGALPDLIATAFRITRAEGTGRVLRGDPRELLAASVTGEVPAVFRLPDFIPGAVPFSGAIDLALRRYLAARLVAGWIVFQADDIRGVVRYLRLCLDTVLLFASSRDGSEIEERRWKESIRCADLWILHHCDPELLARNLG